MCTTLDIQASFEPRVQGVKRSKVTKSKVRNAQPTNNAIRKKVLKGPQEPEQPVNRKLKGKEL